VLSHGSSSWKDDCFWLYFSWINLSEKIKLSVSFRKNFFGSFFGQHNWCGAEKFSKLSDKMNGNQMELHWRHLNVSENESEGKQRAKAEWWKEDNTRTNLKYFVKSQLKQNILNLFDLFIVLIWNLHQILYTHRHQLREGSLHKYDSVNLTPCPQGSPKLLNLSRSLVEISVLGL